MSQIKHLKGHCSHCGGKLEFPADALGITVECPHCSQQTELMLPPPPDTTDSAIPARAIVWAVIAIIILGGGLVGALIALKKAERLYGRQKPSTISAQTATNATPAISDSDPATKAQFRVSHIKLDKNQGSSLMYAVGTISNLTDRQRFGVKLELDLLDSSNQKIGTARDYQQVIEPKGQWQFKALVVEPKTSSAKLAAITEDQ